MMDTLDTEGVFRLIESVTSPKTGVFCTKWHYYKYGVLVHYIFADECKIKKGEINANKYGRRS